MLHISRVETRFEVVTELTLADRFIALAQDADRAGFPAAAATLVRLACAVFDEACATTH